jgi:hypothetical protein
MSCVFIIPGLDVGFHIQSGLGIRITALGVFHDTTDSSGTTPGCYIFTGRYSCRVLLSVTQYKPKLKFRVGCLEYAAIVLADTWRHEGGERLWIPHLV